MNWNLLWTALGSVAAIVSILYAFLRNFKKDMKESFGVRFDINDANVKEIKEEIKEIKFDIRSINQRLSRLEGSFSERGQWEGRLYSMQKIMTEEKK